MHTVSTRTRALIDRLRAVAADGEMSLGALRLGVGFCAAAVAAFLFVKLTAWPPHEDETLALFVGRGSLDELLETVHGQRGGAPLHFLIAWVVAHLGGGLTELRAVSALLAIGSVPLVALLVERLAGRAVALGTTALASASWVLLFHGIYARMYSLFLFTSLLSYVALLHALERGGRRAWTLWIAAVLVTVATHPYGALVLATQVAFVVLRRERLREALRATAVVAVAGIPFWYTDLVLAGRFDVGVGPGGDKLDSPLSVLGYLSEVAGDFTAGWSVTRAVLIALAGFGLWRLARTRPRSALLAGLVFGLPALALVLARFGSSTSPESRHLIFALPFFTMLIAIALVELGGRRRQAARALVLGLAVVISTEVAWAREKTPPLFTGDAQARIEARRAASAWLAATSRPDDVLFAYEPVYLGAWERSAHVSRTVVPRADPKLALDALRGAPKPLGRGVWVFDAADTNNIAPKLTIEERLPYPQPDFEARSFGPYLVIRTKRPSRTIRRYLAQASQVMIVGKDLLIGDADVNFVTVRRAAYRLARSSDRSASTTSR